MALNFLSLHYAGFLAYGLVFGMLGLESLDQEVLGLIPVPIRLLKVVTTLC